MSEKILDSLLSYIMNHDTDKLQNYDIFNNWILSTNMNINKDDDVWWMLNLIDDFCEMKNTNLRKSLK